MLSFSHVEVAKYFYPKLKNIPLGFKLDKRSFFRGNVLPDKQRHNFNTHYYAESKSDCVHYLKRANDQNLNDFERSEALGIVFHFICDYFCKYHSVQPYKVDVGIKHFIYEAQIHLILKSVQIRRKLYRVSHVEDRIFTGYDLSKLVGEFGDIEHLMRMYLNQHESIVNDLTYSFAAIRGVLISVLGLQFNPFEDISYRSSMDRYSIMPRPIMNRDLVK